MKRILAMILVSAFALGGNSRLSGGRGYDLQL